MAVTHTTPQVRARTKTVTRRVGWKTLTPGTYVTLCQKVRGRVPGQPLDRITTVRVTNVRREPLDRLTADPAYGAAEMALEGFPGMSPDEFITRFFPGHSGDVTRIEWEYEKSEQ